MYVIANFVMCSSIKGLFYICDYKCTKLELYEINYLLKVCVLVALWLEYRTSEGKVCGLVLDWVVEIVTLDKILWATWPKEGFYHLAP